MPKTIIISDLDGTLLDSVDYSFAAAAPALKKIQALDVPLILCSSKTRAEIEEYRRLLGNTHPFITENGGGIFIPYGYFTFPFEAGESDGYRCILLGMPYAEVRKIFIQLRGRLGVKVRGFADMTVSEIAGLTGLTANEAELARQRDFDEPFIFEGAADEHFLQAINKEGLGWTQGRIFHIMGKHDKGLAVKILKRFYEKQFGNVFSIGLGDSLNDQPLLQMVDRPVLVCHTDGSYESRIDIPGLLKPGLPGPQGWNEAVLEMLSGVNTPRVHAIDILHSIFCAAIAAVDPYRAVLDSVTLKNNCLHVENTEYKLANFNRIIVVGAGKATARMAMAIEKLLGKKISAGLIIVKEGHTADLEIIGQVEASHPVPNKAGVNGTQQLLEMLHAADEKALVICLLSGGASALMVAPVEDVVLQDKQEVTALLLKSGASIGEINAVRKHLSAVKGGRLAQAAYPAEILTLILSDVIGDRLDVIASGPTAPDSTSFADAWAVIEKYGLNNKAPKAVIDYLQSGVAGQEPESAKENDHHLLKTRNVIVGGIRHALAAGMNKSQTLGVPSEIVTAELQGEARAAAGYLAQKTLQTYKKLSEGEWSCLLSGGETTVTVAGGGRGGRNQELALAFSLEIAGSEGVFLLSAGTDGNDGPTDAAGAFADGHTAALARQLGLEPLAYLEKNDSYGFFQELDALSGGRNHFITGPTGTNVMDVQIILLDKGHIPMLTSGRGDEKAESSSKP